MYRVVFFGMSGGFSAVSLRAIASSGIKPVLVVQGLDKALGERGPVVERERASSGLFSRIFGGKKEEAPPPSLEDVVHETDISRAARVLKIDLLRTTDANAVRCRATVAAAEPDAFVVAGFPHLLSEDVLKLAKKGGLNLHPGKLPEERGPSPLFWALRDGHKQLHFTVHMLDRGEDTGDIVSSGAIALTPGAEGLEMLSQCAKAAAPQLVRALRGLLQGDLVRQPQPKLGARRRPRPAFRDGRIDVSKSAEAVYTFAAACVKTHSIYAECGGDRFFIRSAVSYDLEAKLAFEYALTGDRLLLRCHPGVVELELKPEGALFTAEYEEDGH
jgi:methionyl-tRNA formyltransferase